MKQAKIIEENRIVDLGKYLRETDAEEIIIRTTLVSGGWHDNEFTANYYGFSISRFNYIEYEKKHQFSGCYHLVRRREKQ